jgi:hypothetical protein
MPDTGTAQEHSKQIQAITNHKNKHTENNET